MNFGHELTGDNYGEARMTPLKRLLRAVIMQRPVQGQTVGKTRDTVGKDSNQAGVSARMGVQVLPASPAC